MTSMCRFLRPKLNELIDQNIFVSDISTRVLRYAKPKPYSKTPCQYFNMDVQFTKGLKYLIF